MIYTFKITTFENHKFIRLIELDPENTFSAFHLLIQQTSNFDSDQMASFFLLDEKSNKRVEITLLDMGSNGIQRHTMSRTKIKDLMKSKGQKLLYVFDFFNDRSYFVELTGISMERNLDGPVVAFEEGRAPSQNFTNDLELLDVPNLGYSELYHDYGELDDYTEIFGEMNDFIGRGN